MGKMLNITSMLQNVKSFNFCFHIYQSKTKIGLNILSFHWTDWKQKYKFTSPSTDYKFARLSDSWALKVFSSKFTKSLSVILLESFLNLFSQLLPISMYGKVFKKIVCHLCIFLLNNQLEEFLYLGYCLGRLRI